MHTQWKEREQNLEELLNMVKQSGVSSIAICQKDYRDKENYKILQNLKIPGLKIYPGLPKLFKQREGSINTINPRDNGPKRTIEQKVMMLKQRSNNVFFNCEVQIRHADKIKGVITPEGERFHNPMSERLRPYFKFLKRRNLPIFLHWEFLQYKKDLPKMNRFFSKYKNSKIIITHMGYGNPKQVSLLLEKHPNLFFTFSKREYTFKIFKLERHKKAVQESITDEKNQLFPEWKDLLIKYQDRLMFGTDAHRIDRWDKYPQIVKTYREILGQLPKTVAEKIAYKNSEKLFH